MKRALSLFIVCLLLTGMFSGCGKEEADKKESSTPAPTTTTNVENKTKIKVASLKGPTTMGMVKMMADSKEGKTKNDYDVTMYGTADEFVSSFIKGEIDVACVPANLASVLYAKSKGKIQVAAINTLGVLYIVETGDSVQSIADLKGKTIYSTGKGTTPEFVMNYILSENGIDPQKDVTIEYKSESSEVAALLAKEDGAIAMLPQPFVTVAGTKNKKLRVALEMTTEWDKLNKDTKSQLVTGVVVAQKSFIESNKEAFQTMLNEYEASTKFVNANVEEAAKLVGSYDIVPEPVAKIAIPKCNITFIKGEEMKTALKGYLNVLMKQNASSVGGSLPDEEFYFTEGNK